MYEPPRILSPLLFVPGVLFDGAVRLRNRMFSMQLLSSRRLPAPVISVGNLTLGGAGKTPIVMFLSRLLLDIGAVPALLSRGYGRHAPRDLRIVEPGAEISAAASGDEPALIRRRVPGVWLGIAADRYRAGMRILEHRQDVVFILDDGFQHQQLHRDLNVVVIDQRQPLQSNRVFPRGSLREPLSSLHRAQVIICNDPPSGPAGTTEETIRRFQPAAAVLHCRQEIESLVPYDRWCRGATEHTGRAASAFLVAAVGNPRRFQTDVEQLGVMIKGARFYRDHARLTRHDWDSTAAAASRLGAEAIITTEKDAIKMGHAPAFPVLIAVQKTSIVEAAQFEGILRKLLEKASAENFAG